MGESYFIGILKKINNFIIISVMSYGNVFPKGSLIIKFDAD